MGFSEIWKYKKVEENHEEKRFVKNLIVGSDIFAIDLFLHLDAKDPERVKILSDESIDEENFEFLGPSLVRGETNIELLKQRGVALDEKASESVFYKEMKFHSFNSRTKPMPLLWGEEQFTQEHVELSPSQVYPGLKSEETIKKVNESTLVLRIKSIERSEPTDLIDIQNWRVHCTNGEVIECENIYWGETPAHFYELCDNKKDLPDSFVEFCESTRTPCVLYVDIKTENKITDKSDTFFLPISMTHEWGHFIGEVVDDNEGQIAKFLTFINKEESSEEDISKKIRLLKKNLEKNFENFTPQNIRETVILKENAYCPKIDDSLFENSENTVDNLHFFSFNAPFDYNAQKVDSFEDSWKSASLMTRALLVQDVVKSL